MTADVFAARAAEVAEVARYAAARGWAPATSGNFSAVVSRDPLRLAITPSGVDKGTVAADAILEVDSSGACVRGAGQPSAETPLHLAIVAARGAGAVAHTHSVWSTVASEAATGEASVVLEGREMLKALRGVETHDHEERLPVVANTQDWAGARTHVERILAAHPRAHGFLIRGHGLYTWGEDVAEARRHLEALEFLLEVVVRRR